MWGPVIGLPCDPLEPERLAVTGVDRAYSEASQSREAGRGRSHVVMDASSLAVLKNGVLVPVCTGAPGVASPDPCVASRTTLPSGDAQIVVLTTRPLPPIRPEKAGGAAGPPLRVGCRLT